MLAVFFIFVNCNGQEKGGEQDGAGNFVNIINDCCWDSFSHPDFITIFKITSTASGRCRNSCGINYWEKWL